MLGASKRETCASHILPLQHFLLQAITVNMRIKRSRGGKEYAYSALVVSSAYLYNLHKLLSVQPYHLQSAVRSLNIILCIPCFIQVAPQSRPSPCGEGQHAAPSRTARRLASMCAIRPHYIGPFNKECCHCHALHWLAEKRSVTPKRRPQFSDCCRSGEVQIAMLDPIPADLRRLYEANDTKSIEFRWYIRSYNNSLAFTSTGGSGNLIGSSYNGRGPPLYKVQGEIHHQISSPLPNEDERLLYSQMYIYDHDEALQYRESNNRDRDPDTLWLLQTLIEQHHTFVDVYLQTELCRTTPLTEYRIQLDFCKGSDHHRYNLPTGQNKLALIIPGDEDSCANSRDIILRPCRGPLVRISECHPAYIALHFPLLSPTGQLSWSPEIRYVFADNSV
jgi:hypothetical protein